MQLIFLYGPPGVGKLTVANELAKLTGYKIFHNHLTIDLVESIFDWGSKSFNEFVVRYRLELIEAAAREDIPGLITTFVYAKDFDDAFVQKIVGCVEKHGGEVLFVQLYCDKAELHKRLKDPSRKKYGKMTKVKMLKTIMSKYELFQTVPYRKNLSIDNTKLSARRTARLIQQHFALPILLRSKKRLT